MGILGDLVLAFHAAWVLFNLFAPVWAWRRPRVRTAHLAAMAGTLVFAFTLGACPLTFIENRLRLESDSSAAYSGSFIRHYLREIVYWDVPEAWLAAGSCLWFALWGAVYAWLWAKSSSRRRPC